MEQPKRRAAQAVRVTPQAHAELSSLAYALTGAAGRRVSLSDALSAACVVASADLPAAVAALPAEGDHLAP